MTFMGFFNKRRLLKTAVVFLLIGLLFFSAVRARGCGGNKEDHLYPLCVRVSTVEDMDDVVEFTDGAGNVWSMVIDDDWEVGDYAALLMHDHNTPHYIYDDKIIMVRYGGIFEK